MIFGKKPIMSPALEREVIRAVAQYTKHQQWKRWGLHNIRKQGIAILLYGPTGTGKTVIAEYLALRIRKKGLKQFSFAEFGSGDPGEQSRQIRKFFADAKENGNMTIYMDECEAILWSRASAGNDAKWMLEVIDEILVQITKYEGLIILSSNLPQMLDFALFSRLITIKVDKPELPERIRLWESKIPEAHPLKTAMTEDDIEQIAALQLTGREIENVIILYSSDCLVSDRKPSFKGLLECAKQELAKINANETTSPTQD